MNSFHLGSKKSGTAKKRTPERTVPKEGIEVVDLAPASAAGLLAIKLTDAQHLTEGRQAIYCQFTLGSQRVYSRYGGLRNNSTAAAAATATATAAATADASTSSLQTGPVSVRETAPSRPKSIPPNAVQLPFAKRPEIELVWDELFNLLVEHKVKELQLTVYQASPDGDKVIGTHTVNLSDCTEHVTNTFCVKLSKPKGGLVWFQVKFFSLFTATESKEYEEYLTMISEQTFLDLFKKDRYGFVLNENEMPDYKNYMRNRSKHQPAKVFTRKQWQQYKNIKEYKPLVRKGMPAGHRAEVWLCTSRAKHRKRQNKGMYWTLLEVHAYEVSAHTQQIVKDLSRTFPGHKVFASKKGREPLKRVLTAYSWKNSSIGYCQAMNFIAGFLLLFMDEESAFWMLTTVIEEMLPDYYTPAMIGAKADQIVFKSLLQKKLPQVHAHLEALNVPYHQIIIQWLLSLYIEFLPTETLLRVFDMFFSEGSVVLLRIALAIFKMKERAILATKDFDECWSLLKTLPRSIYDPDALFKTAYSDLGSLKDVKIWGRRSNAYREIEEQEALSNFISLRQPFRFLDGKSLLRVVKRLNELRPSLMPTVSGSSYFASVAALSSSPSSPSPFESTILPSPRRNSEFNIGFRIDIDTLLTVLLEIDPLLDEHHVRTLFKAFDPNTHGVVEFHELICGLSVIFNGAPLQKLLACFQAYDEDKTNRLTIKQMQMFVETHYKWLLRLLNKDKDGTTWHVQATVQHDTEGLWKKLRPYLEEKGALDFVEFRFKVATELEALNHWLESEPTAPGPRTRTRTAAAIHADDQAVTDRSSRAKSLDGEEDSSGDDSPPLDSDNDSSNEDEEERNSSTRSPVQAASLSPQVRRASPASIEKKGINDVSFAHQSKNGESRRKPGRGSIDDTKPDGLSTPSEEMFHPMPVGSPPPNTLKASGGAMAPAVGVDGWLIDSLRELGLENDSNRTATNGQAASSPRSPPPSRNLRLGKD